MVGAIGKYNRMIRERCYNGDKILKDEIENLKREFNRKEGDKIDVNDYGVCEIENLFAYLVIEEDGSVRWYLNPNEHSDIIIRSEKVRFVEAR